VCARGWDNRLHWFDPQHRSWNEERKKKKKRSPLKSNM
jgi:hypothetical protein